MLGKKRFQPKLIYNLTLEDLVPENDFYRRLEKILDLRFVYQECKNLYGRTGNPSIDPVVFFKISLYGFFEKITSDRELVKKASDRLSIRYYLGYDIDEQLPWHSTISRTRTIIKEETFELVFNKILEKCYQAGMVGGKHQSIDSTLVKANASLDSLERKVPELSVKEFIERTYAENSVDEEEKKDKDRNDENKDEERLKLEKTDSEKSKRPEKDKNKKYFSRTDPDSRIARKPGTPTGLYYATHYSADSKDRIITDVLTTYADRRDSKVFMEVFDRAEKRLKQLGLIIEEVSADKGYCSGENLREFENRNIEAFVPTQRIKHPAVIANKKFIYDEEKDTVICPNNKQLEYSSYDKKYQRKRYKARKEDCKGCQLKGECCPGAEFRNISRTIYYQEYERLKSRLKIPRGREAYIIRKTVSEGLFAEAKTHHTLKKFMTRGIDKAQKSSYLIASVQNLKRLMKGLGRNPRTSIQISKVKQQRIFSFKSINIFPLRFSMVYI
jgi:transposase